MPEVVIKDVVAEIEPGQDDTDSPHGTFDVILSAPVKDRDGETVKPDEWEPLPDHITFDVDHGMSVESTVGSGTPTIEKNGNLRVRGRYASTPLAQRTRALVNDKHIRTTSVAFLRKRDGKGSGVRRELLNGSFVSVPANPAALVLDSKAVKEGRRNSSGDTRTIQAIHDHATTLGATCGAPSEKDVDTHPGSASAGVSGEHREQLAQLDTQTLPDVVRAVLAALGLIDPDDDTHTDEPSAASPSADDSAEDTSAEPSAEDDAADRVALSVRASRIRAMSALATSER